LCIGLTFAQNMLHKRHTRHIQPFIACFQDLSTCQRPFSTGTAIKNAVKEPTERDGMPVTGPRRTSAMGIACSPTCYASRFAFLPLPAWLCTHHSTYPLGGCSVKFQIPPPHPLIPTPAPHCRSSEFTSRRQNVGSVIQMWGARME
jgi:hypothetical protein